MADITTIAPEATILVNSLAEANTSSEALPIVSTNTNNAISSNTDENNTKGSTNISIYATGNGATANTGLKKSNQNLAGLCRQLPLELFLKMSLKMYGVEMRYLFHLRSVMNPSLSAVSMYCLWKFWL